MISHSMTMWRSLRALTCDTTTCVTANCVALRFCRSAITNSTTVGRLKTLLVVVSPSMPFSTRRGLRRLSSLPWMMKQRQSARKPQSWHKMRSQQSTATAAEHQFRGKLPQPFLLTSVRTGFLLRTRNAGGVVRFQRRSLREVRQW